MSAENKYNPPQVFDPFADSRKLQKVMANLKNPAHESIEQNQASFFHLHVARMIKKFNATLDQTSEVGVRLVNFGQTIIFHLRTISHINPSLIVFGGETDDGDPVELIQHVSQISILLMKLPRRNPEEPKKPIGFGSETESPAASE